MKNYMLIAATSFLIMTACKDPKTDESVVRERDSLLMVIDERETSVNDFINSFDEIERNLDSVSIKQNVIVVNSAKTGDLNTSQKARINSEIKAINELMKANSEKLKQLNGKLKKTNKKNAQLEKVITTLNNQLTLKYIELNELSNQLNSLNMEIGQLQISMDTLLLRNSMQAQTISDKNNELHAAYYIVASSTDLQMWNLVDKQGGLLGIGQTSKLSNNLDMNMFSKIDYLETTVIPVNSKGIRIISTHPTGSFSLNKEGKTVQSVIINDPEKFWSVSKYLVISK